MIVDGTTGSPFQQTGMESNGLPIVVFAACVLVHVMKRNIAVHQRCGVWFSGIGLMAWIMIHQAPVGFDPETFTGPFLLFWSGTNFLLPLALAESYLPSSPSKSQRDRSSRTGLS